MVEHHVANVRVVSSNLIARFNSIKLRCFVSEFKNENITVKVEKSPGCHVKFEISVSPKATGAAHAKALKDINKEVLIPGFRKGKAPAHLVAEKFKPQIEDEWRHILLNTAFQEALELSKMLPLSQNSIKPQIKNISTENGSLLLISFESRPEVPDINASEITLKSVTPKEVTESDIEDRLQELQLNQATWEEVTTRDVQDGDFVYLDIDSLDSPGVVICKNQPFQVSLGKIGAWLYQLLLGKKPHEVFECVSEKDACQKCEEDDTHVHAEKSEFKPSRLKVTIQSIKLPVLPEIDSEFATKLGAESVDLLKERVITSLNKEHKEEAQTKLRAQVTKAILERYPFDIPSSLIQNNEHAKDSYRIFFMMQKLANNLKIEISDDEIMQEFVVQAYMTPRDQSYVDPAEDPKEVRHKIASFLIEKKVKDYLIEHAHKE